MQNIQRLFMLFSDICLLELIIVAFSGDGFIDKSEYTTVYTSYGISKEECEKSFDTFAEVSRRSSFEELSCFMAVGTGGQGVGGQGGGGVIAPPPQYFANQKNLRV